MALTRRDWVRLAGWAVVACAVLGAAGRPAQSAPEYQLKAVFLYNFAQFVEWPTGTFPAPDAPLVIGVLGPDPFGSFLDATVRGEAIDGHPVAVRRFRSIEDLTTCHILFISRAAQPNLGEILDRLKGRSILTVSDADHFASLGGMIRFVTDSNRIRLRINLEAARAVSLKISSKLLRPAQIVTPGED